MLKLFILSSLYAYIHIFGSVRCFRGDKNCSMPNHLVFSQECLLLLYYYIININKYSQAHHRKLKLFGGNPLHRRKKRKSNNEAKIAIIIKILDNETRNRSPLFFGQTCSVYIIRRHKVPKNILEQRTAIRFRPLRMNNDIRCADFALLAFHVCLHIKRAGELFVFFCALFSCGISEKEMCYQDQTKMIATAQHGSYRADFQSTLEGVKKCISAVLLTSNNEKEKKENVFWLSLIFFFSFLFFSRASFGAVRCGVSAYSLMHLCRFMMHSCIYMHVHDSNNNDDEIHRHKFTPTRRQVDENGRTLTLEFLLYSLFFFRLLLPFPPVHAMPCIDFSPLMSTTNDQRLQPMHKCLRSVFFLFFLFRYSPLLSILLDCAIVHQRTPLNVAFGRQK